ncbi:MAG: hypothetical protein HY556_05510 [Euryarchaeota archaeon]|nr:hypothetical protein [Euryarchaeota archaeon]
MGTRTKAVALVLALAGSAFVAGALPNQCGPLDIAFAPGTNASPSMAQRSSYVVNITLTDQNTQPGTGPAAQTRIVQMTYGDPGATGWSRTPTSQQISLDAQGAGAGSVTVFAPSAADAPKTPTFTISGILSCSNASGNIGTANSNQQLAFKPVLNVSGTNETVGPEPPPPDGNALLITVIALAIVAGAAYLVLTTKPVGVRLKTAEGTKELAPGRGASFPVVLQNRSDKADTAVFKVAEVPAGWSAFMALPEIQVGPKEEKNLWLMVKAPPDAKEGESVKVALEAKSKSSPNKVARIELVAKVQKPVTQASAEGSGKQSG